MELSRLALTFERALAPSLTTTAAGSTPPPRINDYTRQEQWRLSITVFALYGSSCNFSYREMKSLCGVTRRQWERLCDLLTASEILFIAPRSKTVWRGPWNYKRFYRYMKFGLMTLPYPVDVDPPPLRLVSSNTDDTVALGPQRGHR